MVASGMDLHGRLSRELLAFRLQQQIQNIRPRWDLDVKRNPFQWAFLNCDHWMRICIPGNGAGKTTVAFYEMDMLLQGDDPFKPHLMTPWAPIGVIVCMEYQQYDVIRRDLEETVLTPGWNWNEAKHRYVWPNGSALYVISNESDWRKVQGGQPDLVIFDEHPSRKIWVEMQYRRRGKKKCRYAVAATMTEGKTWFTDIVEKWRQLHEEAGIYDIEEMQRQQLDPRKWIWWSGGLDMNPSMTKEDIEHYATVEGLSDEEREVRMHGGYADFNERPYFNRDALKRQRENIEEPTLVTLAKFPVAKSGMDGYPVLSRGVIRRLEDLLMPLDEKGNIVAGKGEEALKYIKGNYVLPTEGVSPEGGEIRVYRRPNPDYAHVMGFDAASGVTGLDEDAASVWRALPSGKLEQCCVIAGHWGDVFLAEHIFLVGLWYFGAFICGERQFGLPTLRRLYDEFGYAHQFYNRDETARGRRHSDKLGYHKSTADVTLPNLRLAVSRDDLIFHDRQTWEQHHRFTFKPRRQSDDFLDVWRSDQVKAEAPDGEHDDHVAATAYALHAAKQMPLFVPFEPDWEPGTYGEALKPEKVLGVRRAIRLRNKNDGSTRE